MTSSTKSYTALFATIIFWASAFVGIRAALHGYSPGALALFRYSVASVFMLVLYLRLPTRHKLTLTEFFQLFLLGAIGFGVYNVALNYGEISVPAGIASFIIGLIPVCITVFAIVFLKERLALYAWLGVAVSVTGIILIAFGEMEGAKFDVGVIYVLIATLSGAIYSTLQKPLLRKMHPIEFTSFAIWFGTFVMLSYAPDLLREIKTAPMSSTIAVIYMGIFPAAIAYAAWSYALANLPASKAASYLYLLPIVTTLMGWLVLGEIPALLSIIGGIVALLGAIIVNKTKHKKSSFSDN